MIPENWVEVALNEAVYFQEGPGLRKWQFGEADGVPFLNIRTLQNGRIDRTKCQFVKPEEFEGKYEHFLLNEGDLVVSSSGTLGKIALVHQEDLPLMLNTSIIRFRTHDAGFLSQDFLRYYLQSLHFLSQIESSKTGSAIFNYGPSHLNQMYIVIPPLNEQRRIIERLDELMERFAAARAKLERVPRLLAHFRRAVLAAACSGALTRDWREANGGTGAEDWDKKPAVEACESVQSGSTPDRDKFKFDSGIPFLKVYNIVNQKINFDYKPQFIDEATHKGQLKRATVKPSDVLMNIVGPPLGKVAIVPDTYPEWNINQAIALFRPKPGLDAHFLYFLLCSGVPYADVLKETRGSAGQSNISLSQCRALEIPLPPLPEQIEIVRRVNELFALADSLEARFAKAKAFFDRMPAALLAKAFRGELVPQDPDDEPASVLLERLRAAREGVGKSAQKAPSRRATKGDKLRARRTNQSKHAALPGVG